MPSEPKTAGEISLSGRTTMTPFDVQATRAYIRETNTFGPCHTMEPSSATQPFLGSSRNVPKNGCVSDYGTPIEVSVGVYFSARD